MSARCSWIARMDQDLDLQLVLDVFGVERILRELPLAFCDNARNGSITGYIYRGSHHVKKPVDADDKRDAFDRQSNLFENHGQHDQCSPRYGRCADRGQRCGKDHHEIAGQPDVKIICLRDEYRCHPLHYSASIHVDGCPQRNRK